MDRCIIRSRVIKLQLFRTDSFEHFLFKSRIRWRKTENNSGVLKKQESIGGDVVCEAASAAAAAEKKYWSLSTTSSSPPSLSSTIVTTTLSTKLLLRGRKKKLFNFLLSLPFRFERFSQNSEKLFKNIPFWENCSPSYFWPFSSTNFLPLVHRVEGELAEGRGGCSEKNYGVFPAALYAGIQAIKVSLIPPLFTPQSTIVVSHQRHEWLSFELSE